MLYVLLFRNRNKTARIIQIEFTKKIEPKFSNKQNKKDRTKDKKKMYNIQNMDIKTLIG